MLPYVESPTVFTSVCQPVSGAQLVVGRRTADYDSGSCAAVSDTAAAATRAASGSGQTLPLTSSIRSDLPHYKLIFHNKMGHVADMLILCENFCGGPGTSFFPKNAY